MMIARLISAALIAAAPLYPATAQEKPAVDDAAAAAIEPYEIKRLIIGKRMVIDKAFAEKNGVPEPSPFSVTIPTGEDFLTLLNTKMGGFLNVTFASPDKDFLESIHFDGMDAPTDLKEQRIPDIAKLLSGAVFQNATKDKKDAKVLAIRETEIGGLGAVEVIGRYVDEKNGLIYLWIVGLPHPVKARGTYAIATVHFGRRPMTTDDEFRETLAGRTLYSFRYTE